MPKGSPELIRQRKEEIVNACKRLYKTKSFKDITMKDIADETSFTRTSIYNYYQTKEEIFLALLMREYNLWIDQLKNTMQNVEIMTKEEYACMMAHSLEERPQLLKILSMNLYDLENGCRIERLSAFKAVFGRALKTVEETLIKYFPDMTSSKRQNFIYIFFPFMFGIFPYTYSTEKQKEAVENAGINYVFHTIYELTYDCVKTLLNS